MHFIAAKRLAAGKLTVVDAANVQESARKPLVALAREHDCLPGAIVFDFPERICQGRNKGRSDRSFGTHVVRQQKSQLNKSLRRLKPEGFREVAALGYEVDRGAGDPQSAARFQERREMASR